MRLFVNKMFIRLKVNSSNTVVIYSFFVDSFEVTGIVPSNVLNIYLTNFLSIFLSKHYTTFLAMFELLLMLIAGHLSQQKMHSAHLLHLNCTLAWHELI